MNNFLEKRSLGKVLTKTEAIIADFFFNNENRIFFLTSTDIAKELKISDTSVIRFVKSLGFKNFKEFKISLKNKVSQKFLTPSEKLVLNEELLNRNNLIEIFKDSIFRAIDETISIKSYEKIEKAMKMLITSEKKYIVGFKSTSGVASFFGLRLGFILQNVRTHTINNSELIKSIVDIEKNDCLFLIAHPKYSKTYSLLVQSAKKVGAKIIIVTDKTTSPLSNAGDLTIFTDVRGISYFNSIVSTQVLLELILTFLSKNLDKSSKERLKLINELLDENV
ncbi:MAG: MurR/RpiR family transcriptional regulator [Cetobacterium sp.]